MPSGLSQHEKALAWARSKVGEKEHPAGYNNGPFVRTCQASTWLAPPLPGKKGWAWCVAYWVKAWTQAGRKLPYLGAGAYATLDYYAKHLPKWVVPLAKAKPGAAVILNTGAGHMAMLNKPWRKGQKYVNTVNGNVHDSVDYVDWPASMVRGVVDPPEDVGKVPDARPPLFEVVTSASGHKKIYVSTAGAVGRKLPLILKRHPLGVTVRRHKRKT